MLIINEFRRGEVPRARAFMVTMRVKIDVGAFHEPGSGYLAPPVMLIMNEFRRGEVPRARTFMVTTRVKKPCATDIDSLLAVEIAFRRDVR